MALCFSIPDGSVEFSEVEAAAAVNRAENLAISVAEFLRAVSAQQPEPIEWQLTHTDLLALGAMLDLWAWRNDGHLTLLPKQPPTLESTYELVNAGTLSEAARAKSFLELSQKVCELWHKNFAWYGMKIMNTEIVATDIDDEEAFVEAMAQMIWKLCANQPTEKSPR